MAQEAWNLIASRCWRDYVQGAYRMRGIGRGQRDSDTEHEWRLKIRRTR